MREFVNCAALLGSTLSSQPLIGLYQFDIYFILAEICLIASALSLLRFWASWLPSVLTSMGSSEVVKLEFGWVFCLFVF